MEDLSVSLQENKVRHLIEAAALVANTPESQILQSYYLTRCRGIGQGSRVALTQNFTNPLLRCPHCSILYQDSCTKYTVKPAKKKNRFHRRTIKKQGDCPKTLFQHKYLANLQDKKQLSSFNTNTLVIMCGVCKHESKQVLKKPTDGVVTLNPEKCLSSTKPKKRKKKDRFSGLNVDAVLSVTSQGTSVSKESKMKSVTQNTPHFSNTTPVAEPSSRTALFREILKNDNKKMIAKDKNRKLKAIQSALQESSKKSTSATLKSFLSSV